MKPASVSIRELKSRLSHYLRVAKAGGDVVITDRGVPVGRIVAMGPGLAQRLEALRAGGRVRWSGRGLKPLKAGPRVRGRRSVAELLVEDRG